MYVEATLQATGYRLQAPRSAQTAAKSCAQNVRERNAAPLSSGDQRPRQDSMYNSTTPKQPASSGLVTSKRQIVTRHFGTMLGGSARTHVRTHACIGCARGGGRTGRSTVLPELLVDAPRLSIASASNTSKSVLFTVTQLLYEPKPLSAFIWEEPKESVSSVADMSRSMHQRQYEQDVNQRLAHNHPYNSKHERHFFTTCIYTLIVKATCIFIDIYHTRNTA